VRFGDVDLGYLLIRIAGVVGYYPSFNETCESVIAKRSVADYCERG
jgi:hypothetical protein